MPDQRSSRVDSEADRKVHERVGYARCELDAAKARLCEIERQRDDLVRNRDELARQVEFVQRDIESRRRELMERLGTWCALDDLDQRTAATDFIRKVDAVRSSRTYRLTAGILRTIHKAQYLVTFRWLRSARQP